MAAETPMPDGASGDPSDSWLPGQFRGYLRVLAETELNGPILRRVDPSDVVQETLMQAHRFLRAPERSGCPAMQEMLGCERRTTAWLRTILANTLRNVLRDHRAARRDLRRECSLAAALDESSSRLERLVVGREASPSARAAGAELAARVVDGLSRLPEDQRRAIVLQRVRALSVAEVAADMERSADAVAGLIRRGLESLRRELGTADGVS